jgi:hypothetical protein
LTVSVKASVAKPGAALRAFRRKQGWTLAAVTQKTGLPISTLSRIETDQISPTYDQLSKLNVGLNIDGEQRMHLSAQCGCETRRPCAPMPVCRAIARPAHGPGFDDVRIGTQIVIVSSDWGTWMRQRSGCTHQPIP